MDTLLTQNQFITMRDQGKFSKKFEGKHSYFIYLSEKPAPKPKKVKGENGKFINKYFHSSNMPNKYNIQLNK